MTMVVAEVVVGEGGLRNDLKKWIAGVLTASMTAVVAQAAAAQQQPRLRVQLREQNSTAPRS
jgi:hypothetical protein